MTRAHSLASLISILILCAALHTPTGGSRHACTQAGRRLLAKTMTYLREVEPRPSTCCRRTERREQSQLAENNTGKSNLQSCHLARLTLPTIGRPANPLCLANLPTSINSFTPQPCTVTASHLSPVGSINQTFWFRKEKEMKTRNHSKPFFLGEHSKPPGRRYHC